jgi:predicted nucleic acid binding AN1-type Zn finger protein
MNQCHLQNCKAKKSIIGTCSYCRYIYCNSHRSLESHECIYINEYLNDKKKELQKELTQFQIEKHEKI